MPVATERSLIEATLVRAAECGDVRSFLAAASQLPARQEIVSPSIQNRGVTLMPAARRAIADELWLRLADIWEGIETGGYLFAKPTLWSDRAMFVHSASVAGRRSRREVGQLVLNQDEGSHFESYRRWAEQSDERRVGDWHCHPGNDPIPSVTDMEAWRRHLTEETPRYLGIIVTEGERGWTRPRFHGWLVTRENVVDPIAVN